jgi:glycosyltransferase involved in cell wall biosynthesis
MRLMYRFVGGIIRHAIEQPSPRAITPETVIGVPAATEKKQRADVAVLTGGFDRPYALGLSVALASKGLRLDVIGSDEVDSPEMHTTRGLTFLNLHRGWPVHATVVVKAILVMAFYARLIRYCATAEPRVFHILWNNKATLFDRTVLMLIYKIFGKKIALTAHNVNAGRRDGTDSLLNRITLSIQYLLVDHIFVHTDQMRNELIGEYGISSRRISVIPFGINNAVRQTALTAADARDRLGLDGRDRVILFFGNIRPYKGLQYLVEAFEILTTKGDCSYRLIIAGQPIRSCAEYWDDISKRISRGITKDRVLKAIEYIPDNDTELYFKAADLSVLPYTHIYQSGVLLLGYSFGLPAVATDVGSFREEILEGGTGFVCAPRDPAGLARTIEAYFRSDLYRCLDRKRQDIREYAQRRYSWDVVGDMTMTVYATLKTTQS